jgi:predicted nucleic acid-binding protein
VISYLDQQDSPEKMAETQKFWELIKKDEFEVFISEVTTSEIDNCDDNKKDILYNHLNSVQYSFVGKNVEMEALAAQIIAAGILTQKSFDDCCHIALAVLHNCDVIVSWNFKHLVNPKTIRGVRAITIAEGYKDVMICDPLMLIGGSEYDS